MGEFRRPAAPVTVETDPVKGSRFIADVAPASDETEAMAHVERIRLREPGATHHCWAWRIGPDRVRSSDDGEPGGTAGPPILRRIESSGLDRVAVVVTRYYGGTNLGTGGLIRAYGAAARAGLDAVAVEVGVATVRLALEHDYDLSAPIAAVLAAHGAETVDAAYGVRVVLVLAVAEEEAEQFAEAVRNATSGRATVGPAADA